MKILYLLRHAKSSWDFPELADFDRPLNKRGKRDAPFMAEKLRLQGIRPDLMLCSPAKRTKLTGEELARKLGMPVPDFIQEPALYEASLDELLQVLRRQPNHLGSLMLVGHNPGLTLLQNFLCSNTLENIPTTGVVCLRLPIERWDELFPLCAEQVFFIYPKLYFT